MSKKINKKNFMNVLVVLLIVVLVLLTLLTKYYGSTDISDYSDVAKFFAGKYSADIRSSHSYLYGFIHAPFVKLTGSFIFFKITSTLVLLGICISVYFMAKKDFRAFLMMFLSPIIWYMAPWINPIQLSSLFFLWAYYFIEKYNKSESIKHLFYSGVFIGLSWAFWDTMLFFGSFLGIVYLFDKKFNHSFYFLAFVFVGLLPRMVLDTFLFNFPFYTILKSTFGTIANVFGGIYSAGLFTKATNYSHSLLVFLPVILTIPFYFWTLFKKDFFRKNKKKMIFLSLSLLLILANPQTRYTLIIIPIITLILYNHLTLRRFKIQLILFAVVLLLFVNPYALQTKYSVDGEYYADFSFFLLNPFDFNLTIQNNQEIVLNDLNLIINKHPDQTFLVGPYPDHYQYISHFYWGDKVKEFVSIQDYELWQEDSQDLFKKTFMPVPNIPTRRQIWISGGMSKNFNDKTDYSNIKFAIGVGETLNIKDFNLVQKYNKLYLYEKIN